MTNYASGGNEGKKKWKCLDQVINIVIMISSIKAYIHTRSARSPPSGKIDLPMQSVTITAPAPSVRNANLSTDGRVLVVEFDLNVESDAECRDLVDWPWVDSSKSEFGFYSDFNFLLPFICISLTGHASGFILSPLCRSFHSIFLACLLPDIQRQLFSGRWSIPVRVNMAFNIYLFIYSFI